jgi:hypothetical protein
MNRQSKNWLRMRKLFDGARYVELFPIELDEPDAALAMWAESIRRTGSISLHPDFWGAHDGAGVVSDHASDELEDSKPLTRRPREPVPPVSVPDYWYPFFSGGACHHDTRAEVEAVKLRPRPNDPEGRFDIVDDEEVVG